MPTAIRITCRATTSWLWNTNLSKNVLKWALNPNYLQRVELVYFPEKTSATASGKLCKSLDCQDLAREATKRSRKRAH